MAVGGEAAVRCGRLTTFSACLPYSRSRACRCTPDLHETQRTWPSPNSDLLRGQAVGGISDDRTMEITDVSGWAVIKPEELGRDASKSWISLDPKADRTDWWLWKPRLTTGRRDAPERRLNDVAEVVVHHLASAIGLPSADCRYAASVRGAQHDTSSMVDPSSHWRRLRQTPRAPCFGLTEWPLSTRPCGAAFWKIRKACRASPLTSLTSFLNVIRRG